MSQVGEHTVHPAGRFRQRVSANSQPSILKRRQGHNAGDDCDVCRLRGHTYRVVTLNQAAHVVRPLSAATQPMRHQPVGVQLASAALASYGKPEQR